LAAPVVRESVSLNLDELAFVGAQHEHAAWDDLDEPQLDARLLNSRRSKPFHNGIDRRFLSRLRKSLAVRLPQQADLRNAKAVHRIELHGERDLDYRGAFEIWKV